MWEGKFTLEFDRNREVMLRALTHHKNLLITVSNDKQNEDLPQGVRYLLQREANLPLELIYRVIEILENNEPVQISSLEEHISLLETALKIYKTDLGIVSETMRSKYPGLFTHKEPPNITKEFELIDEVLEGVKLKRRL